MRSIDVSRRPREADQVPVPPEVEEVEEEDPEVDSDHHHHPPSRMATAKTRSISFGHTPKTIATTTTILEVISSCNHQISIAVLAARGPIPR